MSKFFIMGKALSGELSCMGTGLVNGCTYSKFEQADLLFEGLEKKIGSQPKVVQLALTPS